MNHSSSPAAIANPRCEYMTNPLGIDILCPRLSWEIISPVRGTMQTAYQVLVSTSETDFEKSNIVWDSGKIASDRSICCEYAGKPLESRNRYYWIVRIWDEMDCVSSFSHKAFFEMGLLQKEDWVAEWIEPTDQKIFLENVISADQADSGVEQTGADLLNVNNEGIAPPEERLNPCKLARREFCVKNIVKRACLCNCSWYLQCRMQW